MKSMLILCIVGCLISCHGKTSHQLDQEQLTTLFLDLHLADELINEYRPEERDSIKSVLLSKIMAIHDLDQAQLDQIVKETSTNYDLYQEVTESVIRRVDSLSKD